MSEPLLNWLSFLGFLGVVLAVIYGYWKLLDWLFDRARARRMRADAEALRQCRKDMAAQPKPMHVQHSPLSEELKSTVVHNIELGRRAAISWKVKPR